MIFDHQSFASSNKNQLHEVVCDCIVVYNRKLNRQTLLWYVLSAAHFLCKTRPHSIYKILTSNYKKLNASVQIDVRADCVAMI